ncbi:hypothetical protein [Mycolicibacterium thermoresistibile]
MMPRRRRTRAQDRARRIRQERQQNVELRAQQAKRAKANTRFTAEPP